jgi:Spy/CpxP family protein refolding chaperone
MHVLELRERLKLSPDQETKARELMHAMFAESRPKSAELLEAESTLRRLFAARSADEASVRAAVAEVERLRADVRLVHLLTHLKTRELLTETQRRIYHEARWGAREPPRTFGENQRCAITVGITALATTVVMSTENCARSMIPAPRP